MQLHICRGTCSQERAQLLSQEIVVHEVNTRSAQSKGGIGFLQRANQRLKGGKRLICARVKRASNDGFSQRSGVSKRTEEVYVTVKLLLLVWKDGAPSKKKFSA